MCTILVYLVKLNQRKLLQDIVGYAGGAYEKK